MVNIGYSVFIFFIVLVSVSCKVSGENLCSYTVYYIVNFVLVDP